MAAPRSCPPHGLRRGGQALQACFSNEVPGANAEHTVPKGDDKNGAGEEGRGLCLLPPTQAHLAGGLRYHLGLATAWEEGRATVPSEGGEGLWTPRAKKGDSCNKQEL